MTERYRILSECLGSKFFAATANTVVTNTRFYLKVNVCQQTAILDYRAR